jgi:molybdopterin synthase sulfur carrier subunit
LLKALFPDSERVVKIEAETVEDVMNGLEARWPGMRDRLCDTTPAIRRHINVFVEGERARLDTRLEPGADVFILTAISGGGCCGRDCALSDLAFAIVLAVGSVGFERDPRRTAISIA